MSGFSNIRVEIDAPKGVAVVRFDRPAKRNAFSQAMIGEIVSALAQLDVSDDVRAVVLTGGPEGPFCGESKSTSVPPATAPADRATTNPCSAPAISPLHSPALPPCFFAETSTEERKSPPSGNGHFHRVGLLRHPVPTSSPPLGRHVGDHRPFARYLALSCPVLSLSQSGARGRGYDPAPNTARQSPTEPVR